MIQKMMASFFSILFFCSLVAGADSIRAGSSKMEITPSEPMDLYGYKARKESFTDILDRLYCRTVVFDDGTSQAAIVSYDLGTPPKGRWLENLHRRLETESGIDAVFLTATHSHAAPTMGKHDQPIPWNETVVEKTIKAVEQALENLQPVSFKSGVCEVDITYDRRKKNEDGSITMFWQNHDREFTHPVDQRVKILRIENDQHEPVATLVHFACHPVISSSRSLGVSGDVPGVVSRFVEKETGGECLFLQGACGEINPYLAGYLGDDVSRYPKLVEEGEKVGRAVVGAFDQCAPVEQEDWTIRWASPSVTFGLRHPIEDDRMDSMLRGFLSEEGYKSFLDSDRTFQAPLSVLMLGDKIAWCGFPGEFFDDFQVELDRRSPVEHTFFVGYCNGMYSYFPTIEAAAEGGYGASYGLIAEPGTGERMLDEVILELYRLTGKLSRP